MLKVFRFIICTYALLSVRKNVKKCIILIGKVHKFQKWFIPGCGLKVHKCTCALLPVTTDNLCVIRLTLNKYTSNTVANITSAPYQ